jgi:deoxycytidine triphosphate deaminase
MPWGAAAACEEDWMLLSDVDIRGLLSSSCSSFTESHTLRGQWEESDSKLLIYPFQEDCLTPIGYDLTVGSRWLALTRQERFSLGPGDRLSILAGETALITTEEYIGMPTSYQYGGIIQSKVSQVSRGLSHISTTIDTDWEGRLLIAVTNNMPYPVSIEYGKPFCTMMLFKTLSASKKRSDKPPGRRDIVEQWMDDWLSEARRSSEGVRSER